MKKPTPEEIRKIEQELLQPTKSNQQNYIAPFMPTEYKIHTGTTIKKASEIFQEKRIIAPSFYIALRRINSKIIDDMKVWASEYYETSDLIALHDEPEEPIKIILSYNSQLHLSSMGKYCFDLFKSNKPLLDGGIDLANRYRILSGKEVISLKTTELAVALRRGLSKKEALESRLWKIVLRHENEVPKEFVVAGLHKNYIDWAFSYYKANHSLSVPLNDLRLMDIDTDKPSSNPLLKMFCFGTVSSNFHLVGADHLDILTGRLVSLPSNEGDS